MLQSRLLIPPHPRHIFRRDYAAQFERWVGYRLHPHARRAVAHLERQRARRQPQRLILCNTPSSIDTIRQTLADYLLWRATVVQPGDPFCVVGRSRADINRILPKRKLRTLPDPRWQPILVSSRTPDHCRGLNFPLALILDGDAFPHRGRALEQHWRSILPAIDIGPQSLLILCGTYRPRTRVNHFARLVRQARLPILDLQVPEEATATPPQQTATIHPVTPVHISPAIGPPP
ncbi:MAG: hypothetical protein K2I26_06360, partial [Paramuribaculum sp.]|nr:hypothetical protein [Paramuribaculum sp.]